MTATVYPKIEIPSKYDIIPIHASDISHFLQCRRQWSWSSPTKSNLRRRVELHGINPKLWFGTGIHYALQRYYDPVLRRDPVETFRTWFHLQWNGGVCTDEEMETTYDPHPVEIYKSEEHALIAKYEGDGQSEWQVRGLIDLLPEADEDEWMAYQDLGIGMLTFYKDYAAREDDFEVVAAESQFSVPLGFTAIDIREESPNFGKKIEVHLRGKRDVIVYYPDRKDPRLQFGIMDHKTASAVDEDYFVKLENDPQCTTYIVASIYEAETYDYPWTDIRDVLYNVMKKGYPKPPSITTRGFPSLDRQKETTTAQMFADTVKEIGLTDWFHNDLKAQGYYEWLIEAGDKVFIQREHATRSPNEIKVARRELEEIARDMLDPNLKLYKHASGSLYCTSCQFRVPCLAMDDGSDWQEMLVQGYEQNRGR